MTDVLTGLEVVAIDPAPLSGVRVGILTNDSGVTRTFAGNVDVLRRAGVDVVALFGPEHGLHGMAQAGYSEASATDESTGVPVIDTYAVRGRLDDVLRQQRLGALVVDLQDIGTRYWTYTWSMYDAMSAAARIGLRVVVLDRPNPLGGVRVAGPDLDRAFASFVGRAGIPQRHGLTIGELALLFNSRDIPRVAGRAADLHVVPVANWRRDTAWPDVGMPWVMPSPNIPTLDSAYAFAATGLLEGTNVSEGRGTTRPFELFGAPYADTRLLGRLRDAGLPGVAFREAWFRPTFHKYAGDVVRGAQLYVTDRRAYRPVRTGLAVIEAFAHLYPDDFAVRGPHADDEEPGYALDRLWGSDALRNGLADGSTELSDLVEGTERSAVQAYPPDIVLYADGASEATPDERADEQADDRADDRARR